jgi:hypothetical protein
MKIYMARPLRGTRGFPRRRAAFSLLIIIIRPDRGRLLGKPCTRAGGPFHREPVPLRADRVVEVVLARNFHPNTVFTLLRKAICAE